MQKEQPVLLLFHIVFVLSASAVCPSGRRFAAGRAPSAACAASMAGTAAGAIAAAGALPCLPVTDHDTDKQTCDQRDSSYESDIDKIGIKP